MRIAIVCHDLHPYDSGGMAATCAALAVVLAEGAEVTFFAPSLHRARYEAEGRSGVTGCARVRLVFVDVDEAGFPTHQHAWSVAAHEALRREYGRRGPDWIQFPDYLGEGWATIAAKRAGDRMLRRTLVTVRTHTTDEMIGALNGRPLWDEQSRARHEIERFALRNADLLVWPGGDVLGAYRRFYGPAALAPAARLPYAFLPEGEAPPSTREPAGALRLLYLGRLERRKGVDDLVEALAAIGGDWELTAVGADTPTAPGGTSMRRRLLEQAGGDPRVRLLDPVARRDVGAFIAGADAVVVPSRWECWPNVAREALRHDTPVVATPVGGHLELVVPGESGVLTRGYGPDALRETLAALVADPGPLRRLQGSGRPRRVLARHEDPRHVRAAHRTLLEAVSSPAAARRPVAA